MSIIEKAKLRLAERKIRNLLCNTFVLNFYIEYGSTRPAVKIWTNPSSLHVYLKQNETNDTYDESNRVLLEFAPLRCQIRNLDSNSLETVAIKLTEKLKRGMIGNGNGLNETVWGIENFLSLIDNDTIYESEAMARKTLEDAYAGSICYIKGDKYIYLLDCTPLFGDMGIYVPKDCVIIYPPDPILNTELYTVIWYVQALYDNAELVAKAHLR